MKPALAASLAVLLCIPLSLHAQAYKCRQADGSLAFQDHPCEAGTSGSTVDLTPVQGYSPGPDQAPAGERRSSRSGGGQSAAEPNEIDKQNAATKGYNAQVDAHNKQVECDNARDELGALKSERPVFHYDNSGNRIYVEDKDRPARIAAAEQRVASSCK